MPAFKNKKSSSASSSRHKKNAVVSWIRYTPTSKVTAIAFVLAFVAFGGYLIYSASFAAQTVLRSGIGGTSSSGGNQCIDANAGIYTCNGSGGETWGGMINNSQIKIGGVCLKEAGASAGWGAGSQAQGADISTYSCSSGAAPYGGAWTWVGHTLRNNHADSKGGAYCLDVTGAQAGGSLELWSCNGGANQNWFVSTYTSGGSGGGGGGCPSGVRATPDQARTIAHCLLGNYGWNNTTEFNCLDNIYSRESGWKWYAQNPAGGPYTAAYGIPQSNPGSKMAASGSDWLTNATTQIKWGLGYIKSTYSTPCGAWSYWQVHHAYVVPGGSAAIPSPNN
jgi:hypothetical protein